VGALEAVDQLTVKLQFGAYHHVVEADIKGFFDNLSHEWLMRMLGERIDDQAILRLIKKWLSGVLDTDGKVLRPEGGTPQGGIISPILANVYLHYALDLWFAKVFQRSCRGARPSCIDTQTTSCAASVGKKMRNGSTVSWESVCRSSDWS
jgi:RNA-directed DNA polymerase